MKKRELLDIYESGYHLARSNPPTLEVKGSRVFFTFADDANFRKIDSEFHENKPIGALDFSAALRRLRAEMLAARDGGGRR